MFLKNIKIKKPRGRPRTACAALPVTSPRGLHVGVLALLYLAITSVPGFPGR